MRTRDKRREVIRTRVEYWARRLHVRPRLVRVRHMTQKWGSCSTSGIVTLAYDLADRELSFQNFVIAHELLAPARAQPRQTLQGTDDGPRARLETARYKQAMTFDREGPYDATLRIARWKKGSKCFHVFTGSQDIM